MECFIIDCHHPVHLLLIIQPGPTGHPFPLKGRYVALIFIHFEPTGHTFEKNESGYYYLRQEDEHSNKTVSKKKSLKDINKEYHENSIAGMVDNRRQ
jgi:hypothetical protein